MTIEEKREAIKVHCDKIKGRCDECRLNEYVTKNTTPCVGEPEITEDNYNYLFGNTESIKEDADRINTNQIKNLLYLQAQIDNAIREFANTILRGKQVSNEEIKDRISYIINEEMRER